VFDRLETALIKSTSRLNKDGCQRFLVCQSDVDCVRLTSLHLFVCCLFSRRLQSLLAAKSAPSLVLLSESGMTEWLCCLSGNPLLTRTEMKGLYVSVRRLRSVLEMFSMFTGHEIPCKPEYKASPRPHPPGTKRTEKWWSPCKRDHTSFLIYKSGTGNSLVSND
jgi:hypothetical protein